MKKMISIPLITLVILSFLNIILGFSFGGYSDTGFVDTNTIIDGESFTILSEYEFSFGISDGAGWIAILIGLLTVASLLGANFLGTGLNDASTKAVMMLIVFTGLWAFFSVFGWELITSIPVGGVIIWLIFTLMFAFGVISQIFGGGGGE